MRKIARAIDQFCNKHPRFGIPGLIRYVVFGTGLVFLVSLMDTTGAFLPLLTFSPTLILQGEVWRLISFVFLPWSVSPVWLIVMLFLYFMLGTFLERVWGRAKFTLYYFTSILLLVATAFAFYLLGFPFAQFFVSAHYINLTLLLAFATIQPDAEFRLFFFLPVKAKWFGIFIAIAFFYVPNFLLRFLFPGIFNFMVFFPANLIPLVLIFNYMIFCGYTLFSRMGKTVYQGKATRTGMNFRRAVKKAERAQRDRLYTRKCAVCGKTDTAYPDMEFRFCSKCDGVHCYCLDHINNHVHFN